MSNVWMRSSGAMLQEQAALNQEGSLIAHLTHLPRLAGTQPEQPLSAMKLLSPHRSGTGPSCAPPDREVGATPQEGGVRDVCEQ